MPPHLCPLQHHHCHALHDGLDSDDIGFPPIRVCESTPDPPINPPNKSSRRRHWSSSMQHTSSSPSPQLPRSQLPKKGLGNKNVLNTVQITVNQAKTAVLSIFPNLRYSYSNQWFIGCSQLCRKAKLGIAWYRQSPPFKKAASCSRRQHGLAQARVWRRQGTCDANRGSYQNRGRC